MRIPMQMCRIIAATAAITLLAVALVACGGDDDDDDAGGRARPVNESTSQSSSAGSTASETSSSSGTTSSPSPRSTTQASASDATSDSEDSGSSSSAGRAQTATPAPSERAAAPQRIPPPSERAAAPQRTAPPDTTFKNYGRTPFAHTSTDAVSTFSLDTDRTSYFLALSWAQNGYTVEPDSVRAEEWVNAFNYEYDPPRHDDSFAITSELVGHPLGGGRHLARIALQAPTVSDNTPLNVTLVLDASGSMADGNRVDIAKTAAETIRQSLSSRDRIAVVHFTTDVLREYTVEHSSPGDRDVEQSIGRLAPHNSTNVQAGLDLGVRLANQARRERPDAFNYIILMSDGVANVDATNPFAILESSPDTDYRNPLRLITIGVGINNYNDYLLEQLAQHGNGWYRYLDDTNQARDTFSRENWVALSTPFADQARAQVTWNPARVESWRIVGYENRITPDHTFDQNRKEFAELPSGAATTVFYELVLHDAGRGRSVALGDVEVRWVDPSSGTSLTQSSVVEGRTDAPFDAGDRHLRFGAIVALAADRYSALSPQIENAAVDLGGIASDLTALRDELSALEERMGSSQAYRDFSLVMDVLTATAAERAPATGYSQ